MPVNPTIHPSVEALRALSLGKLDDAEAAALLSHLAGCPECCRKAAAAAGDSFVERLRDAQVSFDSFLPSGATPEATQAYQASDTSGGERGAGKDTAAWANPRVTPFPQEFPATFGRYRILKLLGRGGMGAVYLAHDTQLDRPVALKIPHLETSDGPQVLERFYREARAAATLHHPNICPVHDVGEIDGAPYLTMAYVEGKRLSEFAASRPLTPRQSALLVRKLALALQEAHKQGVIHRDLKPDNIMIDRRGEPIIMDFGLARRTRGRDPRLTQQGSVLGTPAYMPPEQVSGDVQATGPASDVYSLGVILYELLAGGLPFTGDSMAILSQVLMDEPPPPSSVRDGIDPELEAICLKAMAKKPHERYASMAELAQALGSYLRAAPATPAPAVTPPPPPLPREPRPPDKGICESQMGGLRSVAMLNAEVPPHRPDRDRPRRSRPRRAARRPLSPWVWLAGGGMGLLGLVLAVALLFAAGVFKVKTKAGMVVLENVPADAEVEVEGQTVTLTRNGDVVTLTALPEGPHRLRVVHAGTEIWSSDVTVKLGGDPVRLRVEPRRAALKEGPTQGGGAPIDPPVRPPAKEKSPTRPASSFFDPKNLAANWEGLPGYWHSEESALVGRCPPGKPAHTFLVSKKVYRDFDLRFQARLQDGVGNSGVQFRSVVTDWSKYKVIGPQCEIDSARDRIPPGSLVSEPSLKPLAEMARPEVAQKYEDAGFNDFHIRCVGKHVTITVNGITAVDGDFPSLPDQGIIAWQLHGKNTPREVTFRNIEFTDLNAVDAGDGFVPLFNGKDLDGWETVARGNWEVEDGILRTRGEDKRGWLATAREYDNFELELEYRLGPMANSGVFIHAWKEGDPSGARFLEIQLIDDAGYNTVGKTNGTAAVYGVLAPSPTVQSIPGSWHKMKIVSRGRRLQVFFEGQAVIDANLDDYAPTFPRIVGLTQIRGRIGLQNYGTLIEFRNVRIKELRE
jgi:serine/threonine protein kinase